MDQNLDLEVEEFIAGTLYHCNSFLSENGQIVYTAVANQHSPLAEFMEGKPEGDIYLPDEAPTAQQLKVFTLKIHTALNCKEKGITHLVVFKTAKEDFKFVEIAYRPRGGAIPQMMKYRYNVEIGATHIQLQVNPSFQLPDFSTAGKPFSASLFFPFEAPGIIKACNALPANLSSQHAVEWYVKKGDSVEKSESVRDRGLQIVLYNKDYEALRNDFERLAAFKPYVITPALANRSTPSVITAFAQPGLTLFGPTNAIPPNTPNNVTLSATLTKPISPVKNA